jgi:U3 small nucleolar RNA-associated protein 25
MDEANSTTTGLLTLLNVSAVKAGKRKRAFDDSVPVKKLNKRKSVLFVDASNDSQKPASSNPTEGAEDAVGQAEIQVEQEGLVEDNESHGTLIGPLSTWKPTERSRRSHT